MTPNSGKEVLHAVLDLFKADAKAWTQGSDVRNRFNYSDTMLLDHNKGEQSRSELLDHAKRLTPSVACFCLQGAIHTQAPSIELGLEAMEILARVVPQEFHSWGVSRDEERAAFDVSQPDAAAQAVLGFNDESGRTINEIIEVLGRAVQ